MGFGGVEFFAEVSDDGVVGGVGYSVPFAPLLLALGN